MEAVAEAVLRGKSQILLSFPYSKAVFVTAPAIRHVTWCG